MHEVGYCKICLSLSDLCCSDDESRCLCAWSSGRFMANNIGNHVSLCLLCAPGSMILSGLLLGNCIRIRDPYKQLPFLSWLYVGLRVQATSVYPIANKALRAKYKNPVNSRILNWSLDHSFHQLYINVCRCFLSGYFMGRPSEVELPAGRSQESRPRSEVSRVLSDSVRMAIAIANQPQ